MEEVQSQDMLIDALLEVSHSDQKLVELVSESLLALNKEFWLRFAIRTDMCEEGSEREKMALIANKVMKITEQVVKESEKSLDNAQSWLIKLLQQAADEKGQWHLPLSEGEIDKMRQFLKENLMKPQQQLSDGEEAASAAEGGQTKGGCDLESLLATTYAWMRKAMDDEEKEGGGEAQNVVPLLQKVLQLYASEFLLNFDSSQAASQMMDDPLMDLMMGKGLEENKNKEQQEQKNTTGTGGTGGGAASVALERVLKSDEEKWNDQLKQLVDEEACAEEALLVELQKKKEIIILGMRGGMYEQRVLVEYLQELEERIQKAFGSATAA
jgi:hypothetical protein